MVFKKIVILIVFIFVDTCCWATPGTTRRKALRKNSHNVENAQNYENIKLGQENIKLGQKKGLIKNVITQRRVENQKNVNKENLTVERVLLSPLTPTDRVWRVVESAKPFDRVLAMFDELARQEANFLALDPLGNSLLHVAIKNKYNAVEKIQYLLKKGLDINKPNQKGMTPLQVLAKVGTEKSAEVIDFLINEGINLDIIDDYGNTLLHYAAYCGNHAMIKILLDRGASCERVNHKGATPLFLAMIYPHWICIKELAFKNNSLINKGDNDGISPLHVLAFNGESNYFFHPHVDGKLYAHISQPYDNTYDFLSIVDYVIILGADLNAQVENGHWSGFTPLAIAVLQGNVNLVKFLLEMRFLKNTLTNPQLVTVDFSLPNRDGITPLYIAVTNNNTKIVQLLLQHGASINVENKEGYTLMHIAIYHNNFEMVQLLMIHGARVDIKNKHGISPYDMIKDDKMRDFVYQMYEWQKNNNVIR